MNDRHCSKIFTDASTNDALIQPQLTQRLIADAAVFAARPLQFSATIVAQLHFFVEMGDVQSAVCSLLVMGSGGTANLIDEPTQERWFSAYLGVLSVPMPIAQSCSNASHCIRRRRASQSSAH